MNPEQPKRQINLLFPLPGAMRSEVLVIVLLLLACFVAVVGTQFAILYLEKSIQGFWLTELIFFNLPIHFWISGQFLPLLFIVLGVILNIWMDRHEVRRMESTIRFRAPGRKRGEI